MIEVWLFDMKAEQRIGVWKILDGKWLAVSEGISRVAFNNHPKS